MFWRILITFWETTTLVVFYLQLPVDERKSAKMGKRLRRALERLGPTYIKLGQMLSMRPDYLPQEYCTALEDLLDSAPAIPTRDVRSVIEAELGKPIKELFKSFDDTHLATASISQVHKAVLFSGDEVVVKVLRPDVRKIIRNDIRCMKLAAHIFGGLPHTEKKYTLELITVLRDWLEKETDYQHELNNIAAMSRELQDSEHIHIPTTYQQYCSKKVLVMELVKGHSILELIHLRREDKLPSFSFSMEDMVKHLIERMGINSLLHPYFHADLHPANIIIRHDGTICLLDFGLTQYFDKHVRKNITLLMLGIVYASPELILFVGKKMATFSPSYDEGKSFSEISMVCDEYKDAPDSKMSNGRFFVSIVNICLANGVSFPWSLLLYTRSALQLDGIVLNLCPEFIFSNYAQKKFLDVYKAITAEDVVSVPALLESTDGIIESIIRHAQAEIGSMTGKLN